MGIQTRNLVFTILCMEFFISGWKLKLSTWQFWQESEINVCIKMQLWQRTLAAVLTTVLGDHWVHVVTTWQPYTWALVQKSNIKTIFSWSSQNLLLSS